MADDEESMDEYDLDLPEWNKRQETKRKQLILQLEHGNIINGVIPIKINDDIVDFIVQPIHQDHEPVLYQLLISYQFIFKTNNALTLNYNQNEWKTHKFGIWNIDSSGNFYIKSPLFLSSYTLQYNLTLSTLRQSGDNMKIYPDITSDNHRIEIPSTLIESTFKIGDNVDYKLNNPKHHGFSEGVIIKIVDNDSYEIEDDELFPESEGGKDEDDIDYSHGLISIVHKSNISRPGIYQDTAIDITNKFCTIKDVIFGLETCTDQQSENGKQDQHDIIDIYGSLKDSLYDMYCDIFIQNGDTYGREIHRYEHILSSMTDNLAINVCMYLVQRKEYDYRVQCIYCDNFLNLDEHWRYYLERIHQERLQGIEVYEAQEAHLDTDYSDSLGFSCDICRVEVNMYDNMYNCSKDNKSHDFCISCIYGIIVEYQEMKRFLADILQDVVNNDCLEEILSFCVGRIIKQSQT